MSNSDPRLSSDFFNAAYRETPPWEAGKAQPALLALFDAFPPAGPALDLGCGTGEPSPALARRGLAVLGAACIERVAPAKTP
jgi:2-polyprenyl-3-methyl-5-hydroxy-6-metoxy-1,4-benzoquinol methylase